MAICEVCGTDYESKRSDSTVCGGACRAKRTRKRTDSLSARAGSRLDATANLPGHPDYHGVALQQKFRPNWAHPECVDFRPDDEPIETDTQAPDPLPACVPDVIRDRYAREGAEYRATIDRLVSTSIDDLLAAGVYMPVWRYQLDSMLTTSAPLSA